MSSLGCAGRPVRARRPGDSDLRAVPILAALERHAVSYVLVGGYGAIVEGVDLPMTDLDIVPATGSANRGRLLAAFHDLRHSSLALAIAEGVHPKAIQARIGHSSINVTLDLYGHLFPELDEAIATSFGEWLGDARANRHSTVVYRRVKLDETLKAPAPQKDYASMHRPGGWPGNVGEDGPEWCGGTVE